MTKIIYYSFIFIALLGTANCKNRAETIADKMEFPDSIAHEDISMAADVAEKAVEKTNQDQIILPEHVKDKKKEILIDKIVKSLFLDTGCCKENIDMPAPCCCDAVLIEYEKLFRDKKSGKAAEARKKDIILNNCRKQNVNNFIQKLNDIENSGENSEYN